MHIVEMHHYGHEYFMKSLEGVDEAYRTTTCGTWSVRHLVAHIASAEGVLVEVLEGILGADRMKTVE